MGNRCGCCAGRNCPSLLKRYKEKPDTRISKPSLQTPEINKGLDVAPVYDDVSEFPVYATVSKPKNMKPDESSVHYADIQVFTKPCERSAGQVKNVQTQNATEYATLNFPRAPLKYDNKNGTLV
uniref:Chromosome 11 open reading frame 52 n=1 Tax=Naja naja TaxID=35670 RepID=A0A8C6Y580_NAJNA